MSDLINDLVDDDNMSKFSEESDSQDEIESARSNADGDDPDNVEIDGEEADDQDGLLHQPSEDENEGESEPKDTFSSKSKTYSKKRKLKKSEFIDDEAELSGDDVVSEDELENSDDDQLDLDLVDQEAPELDSEEEEEVRGLYHKQLESEDKRAILLLQEQFEDKDVAIGQRRRKKFRWQVKDMMENSLRRHYDPDDDDSQDYDEDDDDDDCEIFDEMKPRLRRPTAESLLISSSFSLKQEGASRLGSNSGPSTSGNMVGNSDDSNSNIFKSGGAFAKPTSTAASNMNKYLFRDKELVEALSTRETVIITREEKDRTIQKELRKVQSKSVFDLIYS